VVLRELREVLIDVKDNGDGHDEDDGEEVGSDKLLDDIPVELMEISEWVQVFYPSQLMAAPS